MNLEAEFTGNDRVSGLCFEDQSVTLFTAPEELYDDMTDCLVVLNERVSVVEAIVSHCQRDLGPFPLKSARTRRDHSEPIHDFDKPFGSAEDIVFRNSRSLYRGQALPLGDSGFADADVSDRIAGRTQQQRNVRRAIVNTQPHVFRQLPARVALGH
ncbi:hypothetical protein D9M70_555130 [compost metagenome]